MSDKAEFEVKLIDKVKGPARSAAKSVRGLNRELSAGPGVAKALTSALGSTSGGFMSLGSSASGVLSVLGGNLLTGAVNKVLELSGAVASAAAGFVTFGQDARLAFENLAKHGATPEELFDHARALAKRFGLDLMETTDQYKKFLQLQFDPAAADRMIRMGADLRALGTDAEGVQGVFMALGQIKGKGRLQGEEMLQLAERGVSTVLIQEEIGKLMGGKSLQEVQKLMQAGKVDAETGLLAIENAIKRKLGESELGEAGAKYADTTINGITGKFKAWAQDAGLDIFERVTAPLTAALGSAFTSFTTFLESPEGAATIERTATALGNATTNIIDFALGVADAIGWVSDFASNNWDGIVAGLTGVSVALAAAATPALIAYGAALWAAITATAVAAWPFVAIGVAVAALSYGIMKLIDNWDEVTKYLGEAWEGVKLVFSDTVAWFADIGTRIIDGIIGGLKAKWDALKTFVTDIGKGVADTLRGVLGIHSPSRVTMEMGVQLGQGLAIGAERSEGLVYGAGVGMGDAILDGAQPDMGPARSGISAPVPDGDSSARLGGDISIDLHVEVHAGSGDPNEIAEVSSAAIRRELDSYFRTMALEV